MLYFRDSFLLLPSSLKKLANNFNVEDKGKGGWRQWRGGAEPRRHPRPCHRAGGAALPSRPRRRGSSLTPCPPYRFVDKTPLDYIGRVAAASAASPPIDYFDNILEKEYNKYCASFFKKEWNLKTETIKYCEQDVRTLYQIIDKFNFQIFDKFNINIHSVALRWAAAAEAAATPSHPHPHPLHFVP